MQPTGNVKRTYVRKTEDARYRKETYQKPKLPRTTRSIFPDIVANNSDKDVSLSNTLDSSLWKDSFDKFLSDKRDLQQKIPLKKQVNASFNMDSSCEVSFEKVLKKSEPLVLKPNLLGNDSRVSTASTPIRRNNAGSLLCDISPINNKLKLQKRSHADNSDSNKLQKPFQYSYANTTISSSQESSSIMQKVNFNLSDSNHLIRAPNIIPDKCKLVIPHTNRAASVSNIFEDHSNSNDVCKIIGVECIHKNIHSKDYSDKDHSSKSVKFIENQSDSLLRSDVNFSSQDSTSNDRKSSRKRISNTRYSDFVTPNLNKASNITTDNAEIVCDTSFNKSDLVPIVQLRQLTSDKITELESSLHKYKRGQKKKIIEDLQQKPETNLESISLTRPSRKKIKNKRYDDYIQDEIKRNASPNTSPVSLTEDLHNISTEPNDNPNGNLKISKRPDTINVFGTDKMIPTYTIEIISPIDPPQEKEEEQSAVTMKSDKSSITHPINHKNNEQVRKTIANIITIDSDNDSMTTYSKFPQRKTTNSIKPNTDDRVSIRPKRNKVINKRYSEFFSKTKKSSISEMKQPNEVENESSTSQLKEKFETKTTESSPIEILTVSSSENSLVESRTHKKRDTFKRLSRKLSQNHESGGKCSLQVNANPGVNVNKTILLDSSNDSIADIRRPPKKRVIYKNAIELLNEEDIKIEKETIMEKLIQKNKASLQKSYDHLSNESENSSTSLTSSSSAEDKSSIENATDSDRLSKEEHIVKARRKRKTTLVHQTRKKVSVSNILSISKKKKEDTRLPEIVKLTTTTETTPVKEPSPTQPKVSLDFEDISRLIQAKKFNKNVTRVQNNVINQASQSSFDSETENEVGVRRTKRQQKANRLFSDFILDPKRVPKSLKSTEINGSTELGIDTTSTTKSHPETAEHDQSLRKSKQMLPKTVKIDESSLTKRPSRVIKANPIFNDFVVDLKDSGNSKISVTNLGANVKIELDSEAECEDELQPLPTTQKLARKTVAFDNSVEVVDISGTRNSCADVVLKPGKWRKSLGVWKRAHNSIVSNTDLMTLSINSSLYRPYHRRMSVKIIEIPEHDGDNDSIQEISNRLQESFSNSLLLEPTDDETCNLSALSLRDETNRTKQHNFSNKRLHNTPKFARHISLIEQFDDLQKPQQPIRRRRTSVLDKRSALFYTNVDITSKLNSRDIVLRRCKQSEPLIFNDIYSESNLGQCRKIGEGVYGEVFMNKRSSGEVVVLKIIPIEGDLEVNGEQQKRFDEILSEIVIAMELSNLRNATNCMTTGFVEVIDVRCVQGRYPEHLIDLWELYRDNRGTDNDHPELFNDEQLYMVLELANAGEDLEAFTFDNAMQSYSAFLQTAITLAIAEKKFQFEHRDLHWGNILLKHTDEKTITYKLDDTVLKIPTHGVKATIIDFTLSRMVYDECCLYNDLANDEELFAASGDYQFDIYRFMKERIDNCWDRFEPFTNILWLHYTIDKMINGARYRLTKSKKHRTAIHDMMQLRDELLDHKSAYDYVQLMETNM